MQLAAALFATPSLSYAGHPGAFYGDGRLLGAALVGAICIIAWSALLSCAVFLTLRRLKLLRVSAEGELIGVDHLQHGGSAYATELTDAPAREYPPPYEEQHHGAPASTTNGTLNGNGHSTPAAAVSAI